MSSEFRIEVRNVNKVFYTHHFFQRDDQSNQRRFYLKKTVHAARQVNFQIRAGEIFGLLGPNGAGKTTCVKMVSGLIRPTAGSVHVEGMNVEKQRSKVLRKVGVVLEGTRTSIWPLTPLENWLRMRGGAMGYHGGFVEHYIIPILYPGQLTRSVQIALGVLVLLINVGIYGATRHVTRLRKTKGRFGDR